MTDEYLWPARNVAEYAYCPRLFYLMEVEGIHVPSSDTEEGNIVHSRVDKPGSKPQTPDAAQEAGAHVSQKPESVRSLTLTDKKLQLTATLDLAELKGVEAVPVEYRRGRPRHAVIAPPPDDPDDAQQKPLTRPEPWPTDRVQIGLQSILLENNGYIVPRAVLYYAAEKRRLEITIDAAIKAEAIDTLEAAKDCAAHQRPLPLVNDPRCPRCSLQPVCLPDEINYQRFTDRKPELTPRKIWPPRDDGIHVVAQKDGIRIGVRGMSLYVTDRNGKKTSEVPVTNIESLSIIGKVQLTTQALHVLAERNIPIAFLSGAGRMIAMIDPLGPVSASVRAAQFKGFNDPVKCLEITKRLVAAKISNQRTMLLRNFPDTPKKCARELKTLISNTLDAATIDSIRGLEGNAAAIYFEQFPNMIKCDAASEFAAHGRQRRPPPDPINSCLSMAYTMLAHECTSAARIAGLEPSLGAYHVYRPGRPALALDLMEPFRPLVADSVALTAFNKNELRDSHFRRTAAGCLLSDAGRRAFFNAYGRRLNTDVTHPVFDYRLSYRRMIILHARMIAAWLRGEIPRLEFLTTR